MQHDLPPSLAKTSKDLVLNREEVEARGKSHGSTKDGVEYNRIDVGDLQELGAYEHLRLTLHVRS